jgi:hypothetical protein
MGGVNAVISENVSLEELSLHVGGNNVFKFKNLFLKYSPASKDVSD